jgi:two-component system sensor histidine kinase VicK
MVRYVFSREIIEMKEKKNYSIQAIKDIGRFSDFGVLVFNLLSNKIEYFNKRFCKLLSIDPLSMSEENIDSIRSHIHEEDALIENYLDTFIQKKKISNLELRVRDSKVKHIVCNASLINQEKLAIIFIKDITLAKIHADYVVDFGTRKDAILDMISRNLSGPLNVTSHILDQIDQLAQEQQHKKMDAYIRLIRENTQQCINIISNFIKEEHIQSKKVFVKQTLFDVISKIRLIIESFETFDIKRRIELRSKEKAIFISADDVKFGQIIHNLLSNAIKFTHDDGKIVINVAGQARSLTVTVTDNGIGIPEYLQPYIFKKNTPAGRTGLKGEKSIGMGLYIIKELVELMDGEIEFESEENKGSKFTLTFPR